MNADATTGGIGHNTPPPTGATPGTTGKRNGITTTGATTTVADILNSGTISEGSSSSSSFAVLSTPLTTAPWSQSSTLSGATTGSCEANRSRARSITSALADVAAVRLAIQISGLDFSLLQGDQAVQSSIIGAVECVILEVASKELGASFVPKDMSSVLKGARRLRSATVGLRGLQSSSNIRIETEVAPADGVSRDALLSALQSNAEGLGTEMTGRLRSDPEIQRFHQPGEDVTVLAIVVEQVLRSSSEQVATLQRTSERETLQLLAQLRAGDAAATSRLEGGGVARAERLRGEWDRTVLVPEVGLKVAVPASLLAHIGSSGEDLALVVVAYDFERERPRNGDGALSAATVTLRNITNDDEVEVQDLDIPVNITFPVDYAPGVDCAFWRGDAWSKKGVGVSAETQLGEQLTCSTLHFSLFAALWQGFVDAVACGNLGLLSSESIAQLTKGQWHQAQGAILLWAVMAALLSAMTMAALLDMHRQREQAWSPEFFLQPQEPAVSEGQGQRSTSEDSPQEAPAETQERAKPQRLTGALACISGSCLAVKDYCQETALRDALDEVASEWFEQFSELRSFVEDTWSELDCASITGHRICHFLMPRVVILCSARQAAATLGLSGEVVTFILNDEDLPTIIAHKTYRRGSASWSRIASSGEAWACLHAEIVQHVEARVLECSWRNLLRNTWLTYRVNCPVTELYSSNIFINCKMRCLYYAMELMGALAVVSIFFAASGKLKGRPSFGGDAADCGSQELQEEWTYKVGRAFAIAIGSAILAGMPVSLLRSLHTRGFRKFPQEGCAQWLRQLKTWRAQDRLIWLLGGLYLLVVTFFLLIFLANISDDDHGEWMMTGLMGLLWEIVLVPLSMAFFMPLLASTLMSVSQRSAASSREAMLREVFTRLHVTSNVMLPRVAI